MFNPHTSHDLFSHTQNGALEGSVQSLEDRRSEFLHLQAAVGGTQTTLRKHHSGHRKGTVLVGHSRITSFAIGTAARATGIGPDAADLLFTYQKSRHLENPPQSTIQTPSEENLF